MVQDENGEGGRWDVGAKGGAVYLERRSGDDDQLFSDRLEPDEARELAELLTKYAGKAASSDDSDSDYADDDSDDEHEDSDDEDEDSDDDEDSNGDDSDEDDESDKDS